MAAIWSDERTDSLKRLKADGLSASEIASEIGGDITRSAVIGKLYRLGLTTPGGQRRSPRIKVLADQDRATTQIIAKARRATKRPSLPPQDNTLERLRAEIPPAEFLSIPFVDLKPDHCRWPRGEGSNITFCGQPRIKDSSYCASCYRMSINPEATEAA